MRTIFQKDGVHLENAEYFELAATLDCGQAFRWGRDADGGWSGVALGRRLTLRQTENSVLLCGVDEEEYRAVWQDYFDLGRDYGAVNRALSADPRLRPACEYGRGIRILRQEPWETLCSFILSQNNNIPRIKGIIDRLCRRFGEEHDGWFTFPDAGRLAGCSPQELDCLRAGFRARYLLDAAQKVAGGDVPLESMRTWSPDQARQRLMTVHGVGPKVADCTMLFGLGFIEAFPQDVWIRRVMARDFGGALPESALPYAGIAQQYLFYYERDRAGEART